MSRAFACATCTAISTPIERIEIIRDLRLGAFDALVGINLLREGLDIPECALVAILDADKEGFLRSETSLIQTIGRAARNVDGKVILYADQMTGSMERAIAETDRRREKQVEYNTAQRHHAGEHQEIDRRHHELASTSATTCWSRSATAAWPTTSSRSATISKPCSTDLETPDARSRRRPEFRGSRKTARRSQAPARDRNSPWSTTPPPSSARCSGKAGAYAGTKKYGDAANLPVSAMKKTRERVVAAIKASRRW